MLLPTSKWMNKRLIVACLAVVFLAFGYYTLHPQIEAKWASSSDEFGWLRRPLGSLHSALTKIGHGQLPLPQKWQTHEHDEQDDAHPQEDFSEIYEEIAPAHSPQEDELHDTYEHNGPSSHPHHPQQGQTYNDDKQDTADSYEEFNEFYEEDTPAHVSHEEQIHDTHHGDKTPSRPQEWDTYDEYEQEATHPHGNVVDVYEEDAPAHVSYEEQIHDAHHISHEEQIHSTHHEDKTPSRPQEWDTYDDYAQEATHSQGDAIDVYEEDAPDYFSSHGENPHEDMDDEDESPPLPTKGSIDNHSKGGQPHPVRRRTSSPVKLST